MIQLSRIGPFIPPLSISGGHVIATEAMLEVLAKSRFKNWSVIPVHKAHIVRREWKQLEEVDNWTGEPEDIILSHPHDAECAAMLGNLFELVLPVGCTVIKYTTNKSITEYDLQCSTYPLEDLFVAEFPGDTVPMCSVEFRDWIQTLEDVHPWITFCVARIHLVREV
jgi:hypothetical protein